MPPREIISPSAIATRVAALGREIDARLPAGPLTVVGVLRGAPIAGRQVLLVEDIADTGLTLRYLHGLLAARGPAAVYTCVLLAKATYPTSAPKIDFVGFEAPDAYVVGYGLDAGQLYRNLPGICALEP